MVHTWLLQVSLVKRAADMDTIRNWHKAGDGAVLIMSSSMFTQVRALQPQPRYVL